MKQSLLFFIFTVISIKKVTYFSSYIIFTTGPIERRACALQIGHGQEMDDFEGEMDDVRTLIISLFSLK